MEIWEHILKYLYPSQLSRVSMVNKKFCAIVSSLEVWSIMFVTAYGPKAHLRTLAGVPRSKCYMIFMCSSSLHVCERCFGLTGYNADSKFKLPLPIPVLLPKRSTDTAKYLGARYDPSFTIRMCLTCRQGHIHILEEPLPLCAGVKLYASQLYGQYPCGSSVSDFRGHFQRFGTIEEAVAIEVMRRHFGGDVGMAAFNVPAKAYHEKTHARIG
ncbi:hypothetical protein EC991_008316, partial [Linnemannia zychae]